MNNIANRVIKLISDNLHLDVGDVVMHARFIEDLCVDSLDAAVLMMAFEEEFNCEIPNSAALTFITVLDAISYFQSATHLSRPLLAGGASTNLAAPCITTQEKLDLWLRAPAQETLIDELACNIEWDREEFIEKIKQSLKCYISSAPLADCLTVIERGAHRNSNKTYCPSPVSGDYIRALLAFMRHANPNSRRLDSGLTDAAVSIVVVELERFFFERSDMIAQQIAFRLAQDRNFLQSVCAEVVDANGGAMPEAMREQVIGLLVAKVEDGLCHHISASALMGVKTAFTQAIMTAGEAAVSAEIAGATAKFLRTQGPTVAARLALSALKQSVGKLKTTRGAATAVLGLTVGAGTIVGGGWPTAAALAATIAVGLWLAHRAKGIPRKLAKDVSSQIAWRLSVNFRDTTVGVLETAVEQMASLGVSFVTTELFHEMDMGRFTHDLFEDARKQFAE